MHISRVARVFGVLLVLSVLTVHAGCGQEGGDEAGVEAAKSNAESLVGTWHLSTVNGEAPASGARLTWVFTGTTMTVTSDMDCVEVYTYSATETEITTTLKSQEGTECGDGAGDLGAFPYELSGDTLTIDVSEEDDLETAVFVFTRG